MIGPSEALRIEQRLPRAVVYLYSQTGQLREVADAPLVYPAALSSTEAVLEESRAIAR